MALIAAAAVGGVFVLRLLRHTQSAPPAPAPELQAYDAAKSFAGFTLIARDGMAEVHLVDMLGRVVHKWETDAARARLFPNGHLLVIHGSQWGAKQPQWAKLRRYVHEYDWDGKLVWEYKAQDVAHHDVQRLENGNTLFLRRFMVPSEIRAEKVPDPLLARQEIRSDAIVEVNPGGEIVWEWRAHDHLDLNSCGFPGCTISKAPGALKGIRDWSHLNTVAEIPENRLFDMGNPAFRPGNIMTLVRNWWTVLIIDKKTKEIVWRYSGGDYKGGASSMHESFIIPKLLSGAGNMLLFDNGRPTHLGQSFILEIDPLTLEYRWIYDAGRSFVSLGRGSVQRFENGTTLISEDNRGRCFEVTSQGRIVWQFKSKLPICRCHRYPLDYAPQCGGL